MLEGAMQPLVRPPRTHHRRENRCVKTGGAAAHQGLCDRAGVHATTSLAAGAVRVGGGGLLGGRRDVQRPVQLLQQLLQVLVPVHIVQLCVIIVMQSGFTYTVPN